MALREARALSRERIQVEARRHPLAELRRRSGDLPRPRPLPGFQPAPPPAPPPPSDASPFSLEALILQEIREQEARRAKALDVLWELGRLRRPHAAPQRVEGADRAPGEVVYEVSLRARWPAYLVWTEGPLLGGDLDDLRACRRALDDISETDWSRDIGERFGPRPPAEIALLRGDVLLEAYHLYETHLAGGDGGLVFLPAVSDDQLDELRGYAEEIGLTLLTVAFGGADVERALARGCGALVLTVDPFAGAGIWKEASLARAARDLASVLPGDRPVLGRGAIKGVEGLSPLADLLTGVITREARAWGTALRAAQE